MTIQTSLATDMMARPRPGLSETSQEDLLLQLAGDISNVRALIVGEHNVDLLCGLIRRGCLAATTLRIGDKPDADNYHLVLVPQADTWSSLDDLIKLARRALAPGGYLIAGVADRKIAVAVARRLLLNGFSTPHFVHAPGLAIVQAERRRMA